MSALPAGVARFVGRSPFDDQLGPSERRQHDVALARDPQPVAGSLERVIERAERNQVLTRAVLTPAISKILMRVNAPHGLSQLDALLSGQRVYPVHQGDQQLAQRRFAVAGRNLTAPRVHINPLPRAGKTDYRKNASITIVKSNFRILSNRQEGRP